MTTLVAERRGRGRPSNADLNARLARQADRLDDLAVEVRARDAENGVLADELHALSARLVLAITADAPMVALNIAGRLDEISTSLRRRRGRAA